MPRKYWLLLFAAVAALLFAGNGSLLITDSVESNYALTAKEMVLSGDWLSPQIYGHYWYDKPIFFYWLTALAYKMFGKKYALDILFGIVIFSLLVDITSFLNHFNAVDDVMLAAIYGGVFTGIGYGIVFRSNSSTGGMDIVAAIVKTKYGFSVGFINFAVNCGLMVVASLLFGLKLAMFTLISMFISSNLTDKVVAGLNNKKTVVIISGKSEEIAEEIIKEVGRGVTYLKGQGAFTLQDKDIIFVVVNLTQIAKIKLIVDGIDKYAFMIVQDANEVLGRGFTLPSSKKKK